MLLTELSVSIVFSQYIHPRCLFSNNMYTEEQEEQWLKTTDYGKALSALIAYGRDMFPEGENLVLELAVDYDYGMTPDEEEYEDAWGESSHNNDLHLAKALLYQLHNYDWFAVENGWAVMSPQSNEPIMACHLNMMLAVARKRIDHEQFLRAMQDTTFIANNDEDDEPEPLG